MFKDKFNHYQFLYLKSSLEMFATVLAQLIIRSVAALEFICLEFLVNGSQEGRYSEEVLASSPRLDQMVAPQHPKP